MSRIKDPALAPAGRDKIAWAASYMPLLADIREHFRRERPLAGLRVAISIHLEAKTAYFAVILQEGGARVRATGCNPLSTQDDVAAALADSGVEVFAVHGATETEYREDLRAALACRPQLFIDDGGDFTQLLHEDCRSYGAELIGGCEETTTGITRLKAREQDGSLRFPMIAVNDADCKHLFDNRYGTGQSTLTALMAVTNVSVASRVVVVAGYGWCGRGIAAKARGMGGRVIVTEIDPVKAIEAVMDGFAVMTMDEAAALGDIFITATGCCDVIAARHLLQMKDGAILANSGHFDVEISKPDLARISRRVMQRKPDILGFELEDGRVLNLLAEGRLVNLAAGMGHAADIMDMSFAIQARCLAYLARHGRALQPRLYPVPREIDAAVAQAKLKTLGAAIDTLTPEQEKYYRGAGK